MLLHWFIIAASICIPKNSKHSTVGCDTFFQTHMVPGHLVPRNGSPINWTLWTNGIQPIQSPWTDGPPKFGLHGQMVPRIFHLYRVTGCIGLKIQGPNWLGNICPAGPNWLGLLGTFCPFVQVDWFYGDCLSRRTGSRGPEVWRSNGFGTKCATADQMLIHNFHSKGQYCLR